MYKKCEQEGSPRQVLRNDLDEGSALKGQIVPCLLLSIKTFKGTRCKGQTEGSDIGTSSPSVFNKEDIHSKTEKKSIGKAYSIWLQRNIFIKLYNVF